MCVVKLHVTGSGGFSKTSPNTVVLFTAVKVHSRPNGFVVLLGIYFVIPLLPLCVL